jgi:hypothetical protein
LSAWFLLLDVIELFPFFVGDVVTLSHGFIRSLHYSWF